MGGTLNISLNVGEQPRAQFVMPVSLESRQALIGVLLERSRQHGQGHTADTDDQHAEEQLAALAAALICPREVGEVEVAFATDMGLTTSMVDQLLMENAPRRVAYRQMGPWTERPGELELRIEDLTRGLAVGLAELERLLRLRGVGAS